MVEREDDNDNRHKYMRWRVIWTSYQTHVHRTSGGTENLIYGEDTPEFDASVWGTKSARIISRGQVLRFGILKYSGIHKALSTF
jgi:hypothetical protein